MQIIDEQLARRAVELALPTIERAMADPAAGDSGCLHIVIMDPRAVPPALRFEDAILHEHSINRERWDADYQRFARAKALVSWRTGMDTHAVQALEPYRLGAGDTLLWGAVWRSGITVSVSGLQPWYDEAIAGIVACCLVARAKARAIELGREGPFLAHP